MKLISIILPLFFLPCIAMQLDKKGDFYHQLCRAIENDNQVDIETLFKEPNSTWKIGHWLSKYNPNMCSGKSLMSKGHALIHWAVRVNNLDILDVLLDDERTQVDIKNIHGCTPLGFAVAAGKIQATSLLLNHGADPNVLADKKYLELFAGQYTLLHSGIMYYNQFSERRDDYYKVIGLLLLDLRTNPNTQDAEGKTPLHYAVLLCSEKIVELLLQNSRTKRDILDAENKRPIDYARELKHAKIETLLLIDRKR